MNNGDEAVPDDLSQSGRDSRLPLAIVAGVIAAAVGGGIWAAIVLLTNTEVGYVAWGVGLLVGMAMARVTAQRGQSVALAAAGIAVVGLLVGKALIFTGSAGAIAKDLVDDTESLEGVIAWELYDQRKLDEQTLRMVDATLQAGDTLSDAIWNHMRGQARVRLAQMSEAEKEASAKVAARATLQRMGLVNGIKTQFSAWDLLWFGLAVATAYRMLSGKETEEPAPEPMQPA